MNCVGSSNVAFRAKPNTKSVETLIVFQFSPFLNPILLAFNYKKLIHIEYVRFKSVYEQI